MPRFRSHHDVVTPLTTIMLLTLLWSVSAVEAVVPPRESTLADRAFRHPDLSVAAGYVPAMAFQEMPFQGETGVLAGLDALGVSPRSAFVDPRSGRWGTLILARPLMPGTGDGNNLAWSDLGREKAPQGPALRASAWTAFVDFLDHHRFELGIDSTELTSPGYVTVHDDGDLIQIHAPRVVNGIAVRNSYLTAVVNHGNLVLFGAVNWGDIDTVEQPSISLAEARTVVEGHLGSAATPQRWRKPELAFVPVVRHGKLAESLGYRLVWVVHPIFEGVAGTGSGSVWRGWVDAQDGELLLFEDTAHYAAAREVEGGVFPVSNDGVEPDGVEQPGFPMPFSDLSFDAETRFTDSGGNLLECVDGEVTTTLSGPFVHINDGCGAIDESTAGPVLDLGTGGLDCMVPPGSSAGNTRAARTAFYEVNRIMEMARGQLPDNAWLRQQLTANTNINATCGAFWNGALNFYRTGACANTGESAGVIDHEWGHGMDDNDAAPTISNPSEGIADIYAYLRLNESCIGRGFRLGIQCAGYGDPCTDCTGVREIDWTKRASGVPHDVDWAAANCGSGAGTPCGGITHCEGTVYAEAIFDLINRDLPTIDGMDFNTALEVVTRLTFLGAGLVGNWFQCTTPFGGCNADGGYLNYLAVDDDNGNLADGTPHMEAIFAAFDRHQIACDAPLVESGSCSEPLLPTLIASAVD